MNTLEIVKNNSQFYCSGKSKENNIQIPHFNYYNNLHNQTIFVQIDQLRINICQFDNPQVRTGFSIDNGFLIQSPTGAAVSKLYKKDIILKKLDSIKPIKQLSDRKPKKIREENFLDENNKSVTTKLEVF